MEFTLVFITLPTPFVSDVVNPRWGQERQALGFLPSSPLSPRSPSWPSRPSLPGKPILPTIPEVPGDPGGPGGPWGPGRLQMSWGELFWKSLRAKAPSSGSAAHGRAQAKSTQGIMVVTYGRQESCELTGGGQSERHQEEERASGRDTVAFLILPISHITYK